MAVWPILLLGCSFLLVVVCFTVLLLTAIPAFQELAKAGRSVSKLAETLSRELPPTLEAIRLTSLEITELGEELNQSAKSAGEAVKQVNESLQTVRRSADNASTVTRSALTAITTLGKNGLQTLRNPGRAKRDKTKDKAKSSPKSPNALPPQSSSRSSQSTPSAADFSDRDQSDEMMPPNITPPAPPESWIDEDYQVW
ncbi:MAG: DUF948 domain-containing protein [Pseudanabaenaceae cyanobacterium]|jgi:uncharacterized protein YoxC